YPSSSHTSHARTRSTSIGFLSSGSRYLPDLLSFPTRRSSDLPLSGEHASGFLSSKLTCFALDSRQRSVRSRPKTPMQPTIVGRRDRKSTRLNSSHVSISYAVFCLKKKIAKVTQSVPRRGRLHH